MSESATLAPVRAETGAAFAESCLEISQRVAVYGVSGVALTLTLPPQSAANLVRALRLAVQSESAIAAARAEEWAWRAARGRLMPLALLCGFGCGVCLGLALFWLAGIGA